MMREEVDNHSVTLGRVRSHREYAWPAVAHGWSNKHLRGNMIESRRPWLYPRTKLGFRADWVESLVVAKMVRQGDDELREYCRQENTVVPPPTQRLIGKTRNSRCGEYDRVAVNEMEK
jgi:hypothetical protein